MPSIITSPSSSRISRTLILALLVVLFSSFANAGIIIIRGVTFKQSTDEARLVKADMRVGVQTLGLPDETRAVLSEKIRSNGYGLHYTSNSYVTAERPVWFASRATVFYYSGASEGFAKELAGFLQLQTGTAFVVQVGSGQGVDPAERDVTLFVHYLGK